MEPNRVSTSKAAKILPIVISSQRSGLNFVRVCIESLTGRRTPGKTLLIQNHPSCLPVFERTHDAANISEKEGAVWQAIEAQHSKNRKILLLLRNPFELFARELKTTDGARAIWTLEIYISNLNHFCALENYNKNYFYYEDFTVDPKKMTDLIHFMDIDSSHGGRISHDIVEREWNRMQEIGRDLYDINQKKGGGSMSRNAQDKLVFHQSILSKKDKQIIIDFLENKTSPIGKNILSRYIPSLGLIRKKTLPERFLISILMPLKSKSTIHERFKDYDSRRFKS